MTLFVHTHFEWLRVNKTFFCDFLLNEGKQRKSFISSSLKKKILEKKYKRKLLLKKIVCVLRDYKPKTHSSSTTYTTNKVK